MSKHLVIRLVLLVVLVVLVFQRCHRSAAAQAPAPLSVGLAAKAEIAGGAKQSHPLFLLARQFVRIEVDHYGFEEE